MLRNYCDACGNQITMRSARPRIRVLIEDTSNTPYINLETCDSCYMGLLGLLNNWAGRDLLVGQVV